MDTLKDCPWKASDEMQASHEEEDNLSLRMLQIGAHWWPSKELYDNHNWEDYPYGHHYPPDLDLGYPRTGGVLVLRTWAPNSPYLAGLPDAALEKPDTWSRLSLCANMEERCVVLRQFGRGVSVSPKFFGGRDRSREGVRGSSEEDGG